MNTRTAKTDRRVQRTRRNIKNAFVALMDKKDINEITVTELAALSDVDRKTFYLHYSTVTDVYEEIISDVSGKLQDLLNTEDNLSFLLFFEGLNSIMNENLQFYKIISRKSSYSFLLTVCIGLLRQKLSEKYREIPEFQISFISHGIIGAYVDWLNDSHNVSLNDLALSLSRQTDLLLHGSIC